MNLEARTLVLQTLNILFNDSRWQPELGDTPDHRAAQSVSHFINRHRKPGFAQLKSSSQSSRARPHNADGFSARNLKSSFRQICAQLVHHKTFEIADLYRTVAAFAATGRLTGRITYPSADRTERVGRGNCLERLRVLFFPYVADIRRCVCSYWAGDLARSRHIMRIRGVV